MKPACRTEIHALAVVCETPAPESRYCQIESSTFNQQHRCLVLKTEIQKVIMKHPAATIRAGPKRTRIEQDRRVSSICKENVFYYIRSL